MKNFGTLFGYELKKLLKRKLNWAVILLITGICIVGVVQAGDSGGFRIEDTDEQGNPVTSVISGQEIRTAKLNAMGTLNGQVMDDAFFQQMLEQVPEFDNPYEMLKYFYHVDSTYLNVHTMVEGLMTDRDTFTAEKFYATNREYTQLYMDASGLSHAEKEYWTEQMEQIETPYVYRHPWPGASELVDYFSILRVVLPVVVAVCLCMIFSEDHRTKADAIVFATQESRAPLYLAKVLAGVTEAALATTFVVGGTVAAHLAVWGVQGFDAHVQFYDSLCPRPITVGQMLLPMLLILALYTFICGAFTMLISALTHNAIIALAIPAVLAELLNQWHPSARGWLGYLPEKLTGWNGPVNLHLVKIFGVYLDNFQFGSLLYVAIAVLLFALCWLCWQRSAAGRA